MHHIHGAALVVTLLAAPALRAQDDVDRKIATLREQYQADIEALRQGYENRIEGLETEVSELRQQVDAAADAVSPLTTSIDGLVADLDRSGIADMSQTTLFDNTFNPAVSVVGDFVLSASNRHDSFDSLNRFALRDAELGIVGRVDPLMAYYLVVHFDEEEVELEEAYGLVDDWLPDTFTLKWGRYNMDFGKLSPLHEHDLPFVDKPGVIQEYLGGALRGTGIELHHWLPVGDAHLFRWSVGVVNQLDGDTHAITGPLADAHHHGDEGPEPFGERSFDDFAFNTRLTALLEVGSESTLQIGVSGAWAPEIKTFVEVDAAALPFAGTAEPEVRSVDLERAVAGADLTFRWLDPVLGEGLTVAAEGFLSYSRFLREDEDDHGEFLGTTAAVPAADARTSVGFHAWSEYSFDPYWSVGVSGEWFERAEDSSETWWDAGAFVTWHVDHFNRLRLEARYIDDSALREEYFVVMAQWTVILGSHGHGIDW